MAEAAPDHIRTVDDLHQALIGRKPIGRKLSPFAAREEILKLLRTGELLIDQHIKTPKDVKEHEPKEPVDITEPVSPQAWGRTLDLEINGHHLIVGFLAAFDFPWRFYSFSIANPVAIERLWSDHPAPTELPADTEFPPETGRPPWDANKPTQLAWAYGELQKKGELAGLRGKTLRDKVCRKVGEHFTASQRTFVKALRLHKGRPG